MSHFLVIGASGTVGRELSSLLAARGHQVRRATHRAPQATDQVQVDLVAGQGLQAALAGVDAAFVLAPPGHVNQHELIGPVVEAARSQGVGKVVLMSAMGADADPAAPLRRAELQLQASGLRWNVLRPNWFMQNFNTFWVQGIVQQRGIFLPVGQARGSFIDTRDIAAVAAELLQRPDLDNQAFDLTGAEALDHHQVAALLSRATGVQIAYHDIAPEAMRQGLLGAGLPADYTEFLLLLLSSFKAGHAERVTDAVQGITGRAPRRFEDYARDHRAAWV